MSKQKIGMRQLRTLGVSTEKIDIPRTPAIEREREARRIAEEQKREAKEAARKLEETKRAAMLARAKDAAAHVSNSLTAFSDGFSRLLMDAGEAGSTFANRRFLHPDDATMADLRARDPSIPRMRPQQSPRGALFPLSHSSLGSNSASNALSAELSRHFNNLYTREEGSRQIASDFEFRLGLHGPTQRTSNTFMDQSVDIAVEDVENSSVDVAAAAIQRLSRQVAESHELEQIRSYHFATEVGVHAEATRRTYRLYARPTYRHVVVTGYGSTRQLLRAAVERTSEDMRATAIRVATAGRSGETVSDAFTVSVGTHEHWIVILRAASGTTTVRLLNEQASNILQSYGVGTGADLESTLGRIILFLKDHHQ